MMGRWMGAQPDDGPWEMFVEENIFGSGGIFGILHSTIVVTLRRELDVEESIRPRVFTVLRHHL